MGMEWAQVWEWLGTEIAAFGVRWLMVLVAMVGFGGFLGRRYKEMKRRIETLEARGATTVIHNHVPVTRDPPALGDVNEIKTMTQAEYDALPVKKEKTLYFIVNRENR